jgi:hypothetical protein
VKKFAFLALLAGSLVISLFVNGQTATPPDFPTRDGVVLSPVVDMSFGDFTIPESATGGTVVLGTDGSRNQGGDAILLNMGTPVRSAMFEFKLCPGRSIKIYFPSLVQITGTGSKNNGGTLDVTDLKFRVDGGTIDEFGSSYVRFTSNKGCNDIHRIYVGGTLNARSLGYNPAGTYHSNLSLTIVQQ